MTKGYTISNRSPQRPYRAQISIKGEIRQIGYFATPEEATAAYLTEREKHPCVSKKGKARINGKWILYEE